MIEDTPEYRNGLYFYHNNLLVGTAIDAFAEHHKDSECVRDLAIIAVGVLDYQSKVRFGDTSPEGQQHTIRALIELFDEDSR